MRFGCCSRTEWDQRHEHHQHQCDHAPVPTVVGDLRTAMVASIELGAPTDIHPATFAMVFIFMRVLLRLPPQTHDPAMGAWCTQGWT